MTIIDVFIRYLIAVPLCSKEAQDVVRAICVHVICIYGVPQTIITDQITEIVYHVLQEVANILLMCHGKITAFHPVAQCHKNVLTLPL